MPTILLIMATLILPSVAFGASYTMLEPLPFISGTNVNFPALMQAFFQLCMIAGAVLAVLMITLGGIQYMTSDLLGAKEAGRERIKNAAYGLLLLLAVWLILNTINPALLDFRLTLAGIGRSNTQSTLPTLTTGTATQTQAPPQVSPVQNADGTPITRPDGVVVTAPAQLGNSGYYLKFPDGSFEWFRSGQNELGLCNQIAQVQGITTGCQPWTR